MSTTKVIVDAIFAADKLNMDRQHEIRSSLTSLFFWLIFLLIVLNVGIGWVLITAVQEGCSP